MPLRRGRHKKGRNASTVPRPAYAERAKGKSRERKYVRIGEAYQTKPSSVEEMTQGLEHALVPLISEALVSLASLVSLAYYLIEAGGGVTLSHKRLRG